MDAVQMIDLGVKIGCTVVTIILIYLFKNQILTIINSTFIADKSEAAKRTPDDIRREIEMKIDRRVKR